MAAKKQPAKQAALHSRGDCGEGEEADQDGQEPRA